LDGVLKGENMAIQYSNGDFEIGDFEEMKDKFLDLAENTSLVRALHVGTKEELIAIKEEKSLKDRIEELELKLKNQEIIKSDVLYIPTRKDIDNLTKDQSNISI
jgi:hypothetical protein